MGTIQKWGGGASVLLAVVLLAVAAAAGAAFSPSVTPKEAELLALAEAVAVTNAAAAAQLLAESGRAGTGAAVDFALGNFHFQAGRYEPAIAAYGEAVRKLPSFRDARKNAGRAWLLLGRDEEAVRVFQELLTDGHSDADIFLLLGHGLMLRRHAVPAESAYRQALLLAPDNRDARRGLIQALLEQQRLHEVRSLVRTALDREPGEAAYWTLLANAEVALGDPVAALRAVETARRLDACPPALLMLLGDLYLDAGRAGAAVACYDEARQAGGVGDSRFLRAVEGLVMLGEAERAAALLEAVEAGMAVPDALTSDGTRRTALRLRAEIAALNGDLANAVARYRELADADPLDGRTLLRLGDLLRETGSAGEAELTYERAGRLAGYEADALTRRARLETDGGRMAEAVILLEAAQRIGPQAHIARYLEQLRRLAD